MHSSRPDCSGIEIGGKLEARQSGDCRAFLICEAAVRVIAPFRRTKPPVSVSRCLSEDYNLVNARPPTPTAPGGRLGRAALPPEKHPCLGTPGAAEMGGWD